MWHVIQTPAKDTILARKMEQVCFDWIIKKSGLISESFRSEAMEAK